MKTIFKEGDKVYHHLYEWGIIKSITDNDIIVSYIGLQDRTFTLLGIEYNTPPLCNLIKSLSFTKYDFVNGGFSQQRPELVLKEGTIAYIRENQYDNRLDKHNAVWKMVYADKIVDDKLFYAPLQYKSGNIGSFHILDCSTDWSLTNPLTEGISKEIKE